MCQFIREFPGQNLQFTNLPQVYRNHTITSVWHYFEKSQSVHFPQASACDVEFCKHIDTTYTARCIYVQKYSKQEIANAML